MGIQEVIGKIYAHGFSQGTLSLAQGGRFHHGFISAAFTAGFASPVMQSVNNKLGRVIASSVIGGTSSVLGGGKFANGAITGAYVMMFNHQQPAHKDSGTPTLLVDFIVTPDGMSQNSFMASLKDKLVANGVNPALIVAKRTMGARLSAWWNNSSTATLTIRNFARNDPKDNYGGFASGKSMKAVVLNGLTAHGRKTLQAMWKYVNAAAHELGHAIWEFTHDFNGYTADPNSLMDYRSVYSGSDVMFSPQEQQQIKSSPWGIN